MSAAYREHGYSMREIASAVGLPLFADQQNHSDMGREFNIQDPTRTRNHAAERQKKTESTRIQGAREKPPSFRRSYAIGSILLKF
ncbi:MAG: hypothetical protein QF511_02340 [Rhodospirillales bacterium]|jgi:hypothetical protein|nr:hypothetical protein [Rhodospirillales bacterium]MDP7214553.1 hypothetical protein [Rhodospirillales bacterium]HIJ44226.1 hypothetical protein [Rhodospirillaceae bacterium]HIJ46103.1 hypothetical protein [Rhodospirillaceae bacterium]HIJ93060.1 hypothetical protein [Rhodospirillaceae bacterium]